ncbi:unnamed protein product [Euphydryas editha]|uniref:Transposase n=1 Tax=Euphydryas editha TaxID=104508 RepID=A0AAU9UX74_EUPED|nr:unnamed protein product [Euphydryas editha]
MADRRLTIGHIAENTRITYGSIQRILTNKDKNYRKRLWFREYETEIHHFDPKTKQQSMTWKQASSPTPKKIKVSSSAGKVMTLVLWDVEEIFMVEYFEKGAIITGSHYADLIKRLCETVS